jgi:hypothetical protein
VVWGVLPSGKWVACLVEVCDEAAAEDRWRTMEDGTGDSRMSATEDLLGQLENTFGKLCLARGEEPPPTTGVACKGVQSDDL